MATEIAVNIIKSEKEERKEKKRIIRIMTILQSYLGLVVPM
jgi:hypothetical protein